ncbi:MAG TPA: Ig-like domain-containing protein [Candidatus Acidoferrales bacterium]|nr:Ig-like domain-containing protein [Candidatus Acidoferrales bacterium]
MRSSFITIAILILVSLPTRVPAVQQVTLQWQPSLSPNVVGYNVCSGPGRGNYLGVYPAGTNTSVTISGLIEGLTYYFVVTAYTASSAVSPPSNMASYTVPGIAPAGVFPSTGNTTVPSGTATPTLNLTAPRAGQSMTNALANLQGTASGLGGICGVWCQLNNGAWTLASTTNHWSTWYSTVPLSAGTNTISACAMDSNGNYSVASSVRVVSPDTFKLQLLLGTPKPHPADGTTVTLQLSRDLNGHLEYSTNLLKWTSWTNFRGTSANLTFQDPGAVKSPRRFYRAVTP